jgi:hypothetical protein
MPIRTHVSQLSDEDIRKKLGVMWRAKPRELERCHQVALIKWVRTVRDAYPVLDLLMLCQMAGTGTFTSRETQGRRRTGRCGRSMFACRPVSVRFEAR